ncbi:hypothetical protein A3K29_03055 [Candidatus Collierbacteria bacterium RIFOXYB2_FULL_46_14]|uniref:ArnT-like N-terminal domain-containing protein n=1 Tax=Candidatus Collierbacteria bacterium GW2011_GWA2_46_26 TaxID=1618381 RepID=A0A0G1PMC6_9BACT|nr:MAG: hypothetical protein UX47_C0001G0115 [Candidatus Collierbacteria bacterium GW2011_GWA2_46_26]OGD73099.1 MAG: hypothetical protein A3K29_03055 [Candidatus Collierbacteria bacterium RIFOXYB2_FULL_46_14]OGD76141.1 MAG: hypothetical protein A3K43_03055 [Candidatus Collierbacteria bacterium RIFOXYA2_FULL_46_20]OGD77477.1 MAG: hypothetical protein A3K39_03055 [Candidatus Collierbacteria bacterium RIFOXYC2_FULL_43_15]OGD80767.1 MAG: hypothetical protein A2320_03550 [Pseudomonadales bacterium G
MNRLKVLLILIFLFGFFFRISGIGFGLPDLFHPDEARIILDSMSMGQRMSPIPVDINYPLFHKYFLLIAFGVYFIFGTFAGYFRDTTDFAVKFFQDPSTVVFISRIVTTILGSLTILIGYLWGNSIAKSKITGLIAALFVALEWQLVFESQYAVHQTLSALSSLIAFLGISLICVNPNRKTYAIGGIAMGFAVASHQTTVLLFPAVFLLFLMDFVSRQKSKKNVLLNWITYSVFAFGIGVLGNLNWFFRFDESLHFFLQGSGAGKVAFSSTQFFHYNIPSIIYWFYYELVRRDYIIGLLVVYATIMAVFRRSKLDILYLVISLTYFIFFYQWAYRWMHLFVGLIPISLMFAAKELSNLFKNINLKFISVIVLASAVILPNASAILNGNKKKQLPETRQEARAWILENIPSDTKIAVDYPAYSVSLPSTYPIMLRNRVAREYYDYQLPSAIKQELSGQESGAANYEIVEMIDSKSEPVWPSDMPNKAVERAKKDATMRDVYAYFNFKPIDHLKEEGVKYIVINSYTYGMALTNDDPRKVFLMDYYLIDNVIPFASNLKDVQKGTQHELLYYMVKREREYFLQLLDDMVEGVSLIKEFVPRNNLGPIVKIYKIE